MTKKPRQIDSIGFKEGLRTGINRGYKKGIEDALKAAQSILDNNGIHMADSEFYLEFQNLLEEGEITPPDEK